MIRLRSSFSFASFASFAPFAVAAFVATLAVAPRAYADALPPNACEGVNPAAGSVCDTAGDGTQEGVCVSSTCHSLGGGAYPCELCELVDAGPVPDDAGSQDATVGPDADASPVPLPDASITTDASGAVDSGKEQDAATPAATTSLASSCSVSAAPGARGKGNPNALFFLATLGLIAGAASRRRRQA
jgi:MYXO-CTERM domain-containing protein